MTQLLMILLCFSFLTTFSQDLTRDQILRNKIKSITIKGDSSSGSEYTEYDKRGLLVKRVKKILPYKPDYISTTTYTYTDTFLSSEIRTTKEGVHKLSSDTIIYEFDEYKRLSFVLRTASQTLQQYIYVQGGQKESLKDVWQLKTYDELLSNKKNTETDCAFTYNNGKTYVLNSYEMYPWNKDLTTLPDDISYFTKCNKEDSTSNTFCITKTQTKISIGDSLIEYLTINTGNNGKLGDYDTFSCSHVEVSGKTPSVIKVVMEKYQTAKKIETIIKDNSLGSCCNYSMTVHYFYDNKGLLQRMTRETLLNGFTYSKGVPETQTNFVYEFYK